MKVLLLVIAVLVVIGLCVKAFLMYVDYFSTKNVSTSHETPHADEHPHEAPAAKSGVHKDHGNGGHGGPSIIKLSFAVLILVVAACLYLVFHRYAGLGAIPQTRGQALAQASARGSRIDASYEIAPATSRPVSTEWEYYDAPSIGANWYTITALPGWTIETCAVETDPNCTASEPQGYRIKCMNSAGLERDWSTGECKWLNSLSIQSTSDQSLRMKWRDKRKSP